MNSSFLFKAGAGLWVGLGLVGLSVLTVVSTAGMKIAPTYSKVGPQVFPYAAALVIGVLGLLFVWHALKGDPDRLAPDTEDTDFRALGTVGLGFALFILTLETLGFVLAATLLFTAVARGFGSRRLLRDGAIGFLLCAVAFGIFTRLLDLQLPAGLFSGVL